MLIELGFLDYFARSSEIGGKIGTIKGDTPIGSHPGRGRNTGKADVGYYVSRIRNLHSLGPAG